MSDWPWRNHEALARESECFETPEWAISGILKKELMTQDVIDPCCGRGQMAKAAKDRGYNVTAFDKHYWGYGQVKDFLTDPLILRGDKTFFMNPPFSLAEQFVIRCHELHARKIVCFQRFAWWESKRRIDFWNTYPPNRIYICVSRATCWRIDIPPDEREGGSTTAHAWFVWERGHPPGPALGRLEKPPHA